MFYDTQIEIYDSPQTESIKTICADVQPFEKSMLFEDDIEIEITKRAFCDIKPEINDGSYLRFNNMLYKIMKIKIWSDYLELWLYECERDIS